MADRTEKRHKRGALKQGAATTPINQEPDMKPDRTISTRPSGNVVVVTKLQSGDLVAHEYAQCGRFVYLLQDVPGMTPYVQIAPSGEPLKLRDDEVLEDAVRRMFDGDDEWGWASAVKLAGALVALVATAVWFIR